MNDHESRMRSDLQWEKDSKGIANRRRNKQDVDIDRRGPNLNRTAHKAARPARAVAKHPVRALGAALAAGTLAVAGSVDNESRQQTQRDVEHRAAEAQPLTNAAHEGAPDPHTNLQEIFQGRDGKVTLAAQTSDGTIRAEGTVSPDGHEIVIANPSVDQRGALYQVPGSNSSLEAEYDFETNTLTLRETGGIAAPSSEAPADLNATTGGIEAPQG